MPALADYLALVTNQHRNKPNFIATLTALLQPLVDAQALLGTFPAAFDLDLAIGVQLDQIGLWVGRSRTITTALPNVYYSWDTDGLGWGQGVWQGPYDPTTGITSLDDDHYRLLLRAKIAANSWDGTMPGAERVLALLNLAPSLIFLEDRQDMSMTLGVAGALPDLLTLTLLTGGYLPLKPTGVHLNVAITTVPGAPVFGFGADSDYVAGWGVGAWGTDNVVNILPTTLAGWYTAPGWDVGGWTA